MEKSVGCSSSNSGIVLPNHRDLSPFLLGFLDKHFDTRNRNDLSSLSATASDLEMELSKLCDKFDDNLLNLQGNLGNLIVSWICRSIGAKAALHKLKLNFHNLSRRTKSQCEAGPKKIQKMLGNDLPRLAKELRRIDNFRNYAEIALKLEALVGDLEDAVLVVMNQHTGMFSKNLSISSVSTELGSRQKELLNAIKAMTDIEELLVRVAKLHPQWLQLMKSVDARVDKTLAILRPQVLACYRALLVSMGWPPKVMTSKIENGTISDLPNPLVLMQVEKRKSYSESFLVLCALQHLQAQREDRQLGLSGHKEANVGLWAIDELVSPIASRTEYHFSKWSDQPELMFALVYKITRDFVAGVEDILQPLIDRARLVSCSAKEAWVFAMVQMLSGFLGKQVFFVLAERYKEKEMRSEVILSWVHLIDLMVAFDRRMHSLVNIETYLPFAGSERLGGFLQGISVFSIFCDRSDWLKIWAKIELKDAWKKLKAELKDEREWLVHDTGGIEFPVDGDAQGLLLCSREDHKAPLIAEYALKIAWEMIERCERLPSIVLRVQFIRSTSARFLWHFFNVLVLRCKRTEFHVDSPADDSLTRLCTSINAARYCESKLLQWSDDVNFLEMRIAEIDLNIHLEDDANDNSCFFGEEIKSLVELETTWLIEVLAVLLRQFENLSREYVQNKERFEQKREEFSEAIDFTLSVDFVETLDAIRSQLHVIRMILNPKDFFDLWRSFADGLDHFIFCSILMSDNRFCDDGINQFGADMQALFLVFQPFCLRPDAFFPCLTDSLKLLKMDKEEVKHLWVVVSDDENRIKYLRSRGISHISFDKAEKILRNRKFGI